MIFSLEPNEHVILTVHKHWFYIFMKAFALLIVIALIGTGIYALMGFTGSFLHIPGNRALLLVFVLTVLVFCAWMSFFIFWTKYYLDYWLITDKRIIDMDLIGFFNESVAVMRLDHIQDIQIQEKGFWANVLGFGTLVVQTAGAEKEFVIKNVANPEWLKDQLSLLEEHLVNKPQKVEVVG